MWRERLTGERTFMYTLFCMSETETTFAIAVDRIRDFHRRRGRMPSFQEIGDLVGLRSKNAVSKLVAKLEERDIIKRDETGRLIPKNLDGELKWLGSVEAGFPSAAEEELLDTMDLDDWLIENKEASFCLRVSGDSMIDAGIQEGDMVIVERGRTPRVDDIVIAEVDGEWTMKYYKKKGRQVWLEPANKKYKPIEPEEELKVEAVVVGVVRKY